MQYEKLGLNRLFRVCGSQQVQCILDDESPRTPQLFILPPLPPSVKRQKTTDYET